MPWVQISSYPTLDGNGVKAENISSQMGHTKKDHLNNKTRVKRGRRKHFCVIFEDPLARVEILAAFKFSCKMVKSKEFIC